MQYENVLYVYERYRIEKIMLEAGYQSLAKLDSILRSL